MRIWVYVVEVKRKEQTNITEVDITGVRIKLNIEMQGRKGRGITCWQCWHLHSYFLQDEEELEEIKIGFPVSALTTIKLILWTKIIVVKQLFDNCSNQLF